MSMLEAIGLSLALITVVILLMAVLPEPTDEEREESQRW
jgi:hypothetical protein